MAIKAIYDDIRETVEGAATSVISDAVVRFGYSTDVVAEGLTRRCVVSIAPANGAYELDADGAMLRCEHSWVIGVLVEMLPTAGDRCLDVVDAIETALARQSAQGCEVFLRSYDNEETESDSEARMSMTFDIVTFKAV